METAAIGIVLFATTLAAFLVLGWRQRKWGEIKRVLEEPEMSAAGPEWPEGLQSAAHQEPPPEKNHSRQTGTVILLIQLAISLLVLISSLLIILSDAFPADSKKWAFGSVGTITGYWLRNPGSG